MPLLIFAVLAVHVWHEGKGFWWDIPWLLTFHATASPVLDRLDAPSLICV
ncbi:MAG: hypothetical protein KME17_02585 [Cyanosarcina radialis HA8281-LM2]|nr:hypothetical protein [Cyanosarcina radialis HA8281-LM2]